MFHTKDVEKMKTQILRSAI